MIDLISYFTFYVSILCSHFALSHINFHLCSVSSAAQRILFIVCWPRSVQLGPSTAYLDFGNAFCKSITSMFKKALFSLDFQYYLLLLGEQWLETVTHKHNDLGGDGNLHIVSTSVQIFLVFICQNSGLDSNRSTRHHGLVDRVYRDRNRIMSPNRKSLIIDKHGRQISFKMIWCLWHIFVSLLVLWGTADLFKV